MLKVEIISEKLQTKHNQGPGLGRAQGMAQGAAALAVRTKESH